MSRCILSRVSRWLWAAGLAAMPAVACAQQAEDVLIEAPVPQPVLVVEPLAAGVENPPFLFTQAVQEAPAPAVELFAALDEPPPGGEYWIGVQLEPLPDIVKSHLKLERGMAVVHVFPDSPAAKAQFKVHDVVLRAGEKDVLAPDDLIAAVTDAKDKEIEVIVLRNGTESTVKVTPAKRPAQQLHFSAEAPHANVIARLEQLGMQNPEGDVRLFAVRSGGVFAFAETAKFPSNLEVQIHKQGDKPATIKVKRVQDGEEKSWEVAEDKLGELPEDIRGHVESMLGGHGQPQHAIRMRLEEAQTQQAKAHAHLRETQKRMVRPLGEYRLHIQPPANPALPAPPLAGAPAAVRLPHAAAADAAIQAKLDAILKKLGEDSAIQRLDNEIRALRKEVEELRQEKK